MIEKKLFFRLCLILLVTLSAYSCRTDQFNENDHYRDSSKSQLISKRISLDEARHKAKLLPELEKAEAKFKEKSFAQGKTVNYGNGISIDTDDVTYIENGPNYHTYTFNIKRENAPADAPVENLVLSPLTDGTYRELLFSYSLSPQEKQILMDRGFVDTKNKVTVTDLQKDTFNTGGQLAKSTVCTWTIDTHYTTCSEGLHSHGETAGSGEPGSGTCNAETLSQLVVLVVGACKSIGDDGVPGGSTGPGTTGPGTSPGGLGSGENDGSGNTGSPSNGPGDCNGGLTAPQTPNYDISDGGCGGGIPTQPTLPVKNITPCTMLKRNSNDTVFRDKLDDLKTRVIPSTNGYDEHETAVVVTNDHGQLVYNTYIMPKEIGPNVQAVKIEVTDSDIAVMHNHTVKSAFLAPSYLDLVDFYDHYKFLNAAVKPYYIYYLACYNGEVYALKADDMAALDAFFADFTTIGSGNFSKDEQTKAYSKMRGFYIDNGMNGDNPHDKDKSEKIFLNIVQSFGNGISLYRIDDSRWGKLRLDPDGTVKKDDCPL
ncbi:hypothetical protein FY557_07405 [Chryseobacterium sp. SN22]|uniref:hypothetical protein n=1 Tax=Chryseobacterium sp. SN22 TaxID=2606431 RepID=UPI0011F01CD0|nr:hypothetical protein [Chryseobacterium sp. SN22]KAA0128699.1 hypothetical protein FY557_07405 [Chryseobacterium sp. SN22]